MPFDIATTGMTPVSNETAEVWAKTLEQRLAGRFIRNGHSGPRPTISLMTGPKNIRVVISQGSNRSVYCFIERATGNLLKSDGWAKPAKHARGNIFAADPYKGCTDYGMEYLR